MGSVVLISEPTAIGLAIVVMFFIISRRVNYLFHGYDWGIPLGIIERTLWGQKPGVDYYTTLPAAYIALYAFLSRCLKRWGAMNAFKYISSTFIFLAVYICLRPDGNILALIAAFSCALAMSGIYQVVWYTELTYLNILAIILVLYIWGSGFPALACAGFLGGIALFQRPNTSWPFLLIAAIGLVFTLSVRDLAIGAAGAASAIVVMHVALPFYALKSLPRFFKLRSRAKESCFLAPIIDMYMKLRYVLLYAVLALIALFLAGVCVRESLFDIFNASAFLGCALILAGIGGLKLNMDSKEPDCAAVMLGIALASRALPPGVRDHAGVGAVLIAGFVAIGISASINLFRAERVRGQTFVPISRIPVDQLTSAQRFILKLAPSLAVSASSQGRDRFASNEEPHAVIRETRLKGLLATARMRDTLDFIRTRVVDAGRTEGCFFGHNLEWLYYALSICPTTGQALHWHNGNLFLDEDVPVFVSEKGLLQNRYFVFTYKNTLEWRDVVYPNAIISWFKTELVEVERSEHIIIFEKRSQRSK
jgi:hypothetical protein